MTEVKGTARRISQLLDGLENRRFWELKEEVGNRKKKWKREFITLPKRKNSSFLPLIYHLLTTSILNSNNLFYYGENLKKNSNTYISLSIFPVFPSNLFLFHFCSCSQCNKVNGMNLRILIEDV